MKRFYAMILGATVGFMCAVLTVAAAHDLNLAPTQKNIHAKIESRLQELAAAAGKNVTAARALAQSGGITISARETVTVYLISEPETAVDDMSLQSFGVNITKRADNILLADVPIKNLSAVADNVAGISYIKLPDVLIPAVESQGVELTDATAFHLKGYTGSGVKVGVIDVGFKFLATAISHGELPDDVVTIDCTGASCTAATLDDFSQNADEHGTAVAEIVHDMAPDARIYLIKILNTLDLVDAKNYAVSQDINIINHSLIVTNTNFYDGKCWFSNPVCTANDAYEKGILWVNAVGNEALRHYEATFADADNDGWHNVSGISETIEIINASSGDTIRVSLTWDDWPTTNQYYHLYLFDSSLNEVESNVNNNSQPYKDIVYLVKADDSPPFFVGIQQFSATANHRLELYSEIHQLSPAVAASSLLTPADAASVLAVGAIDYRNWTSGPIRSYSSQGPTNDGRIKPDISGPDGVSNFIFGNFPGTSASCAHVSGAAALILSKNTGYSASQLKSVLTSTAIDMGSSGNDNIYGYGRLNLDVDAAISGGSGDDGGDDGGGGGGCFIATAAYGSPLAPYVQILREFRDRYLSTTRAGTTFISFYYQHSPKIADKITQYTPLRWMVRTGLAPIVGMAWMALHIGPVYTIVSILAFCIGLIAAIVLIRRFILYNLLKS